MTQQVTRRLEALEEKRTALTAQSPDADFARFLASAPTEELRAVLQAHKNGDDECILEIIRRYVPDFRREPALSPARSRATRKARGNTQELPR